VARTKYGRTIKVIVSDDEYAKLIEVARKARKSLTGYTKSAILRSLKITTEELQPKENVIEQEWPIYVLTMQ
jgi:hypothetical protein